MKFITSICCIAIIFNSAYSQVACSNINIISPVVVKPTNAAFTATCNTFTLQWQEAHSSQSESYMASIMFRDFLNPAQIDTLYSPILSGSTNTSFDVAPGMIISWSIQGIKTIDGRTFYSYPLRSSEEYTIPDCVNPSITAAENTVSPIRNSLTAIEEEKLRVDLYPNPVHTVLNLSINSVVKTATAKNGVIKMVGIEGKTVLTQKASFGSVQVNVSKLSNGTYFIRVEDAGGKLLYIAKFIKE